MSTPSLRMASQAFREIRGVVVSAGLMDRTVKVQVATKLWNANLRKDFTKAETHLVHDPNNSLVAGDIVAITPGWRTSKSKKHVVKHIIAACGKPAEERPPIPSLTDRIEVAEEKRAAKVGRREERKAAALAKIKEEKEKKRAKKAELEMLTRKVKTKKADVKAKAEGKGGEKKVKAKAEGKTKKAVKPAAKVEAEETSREEVVEGVQEVKEVEEKQPEKKGWFS